MFINVLIFLIFFYRRVPAVSRRISKTRSFPDAFWTEFRRDRKPEYQLEPLERYRLGSLEWYRLDLLGGIVSVGTFGQNIYGFLGAS
ncbi:unnamed protein product [Rhizophagus irregularis]|nr:unnamed protein product [Rhizophagus irregularis]